MTVPAMHAYGRASTDKQQITLHSQKHACESYFNMRTASGEKITWGGWYPDAAISAKLYFYERPMGAKLLNTIKRGDILLVSNFDRIFRSVIDCHNCLERFNERGIHLVIMDADVRTDTPLGAAFMKLVAVLKGLEREEIGRRTREALQTKKRLMKPFCPKAYPGWKKVGLKSNSKFVPCEEDRIICYEIARAHDYKHVSFRRMYDHLQVVFKDHPELLAKTKAAKWHSSLVPMYMAAHCGFPRIFKQDYPKLLEFKRFRKKNGGQSPHLEFGIDMTDLVHNAVPLPRRPLPPLVLDAPSRPSPSESSCTPEASPCSPQDQTQSDS